MEQNLNEKEDFQNLENVSKSNIMIDGTNVKNAAYIFWKNIGNSQRDYEYYNKPGLSIREEKSDVSKKKSR